jgi:hypothetical protein
MHYVFLETVPAAEPIGCYYDTRLPYRIRRMDVQQGRQAEQTPCQAAVLARVAHVKRLTLSDACTSKQIKLPRAAVRAKIKSKLLMSIGPHSNVNPPATTWTWDCLLYTCWLTLSVLPLLIEAPDHNFACCRRLRHSSLLSPTEKARAW